MANFSKETLIELFNRPVDKPTGPISAEIGQLKEAGKLLLDGKPAEMPKSSDVSHKETKPPLEVTTLREAVAFLRAKNTDGVQQVEEPVKKKIGRPKGAANKPKEDSADRGVEGKEKE